MSDMDAAAVDPGEQVQIPGVENPAPNGNGSDANADYHERVRADAEFALGEIQKKDSYIGEIQRELAKLKPLAKYVEAAGGAEQAVDLLAQGFQVSTPDGLRQIIERAISQGLYELPKPDVDDSDDDEYVLPEFRQATERMDRIETMLRQLTESVHGTQIEQAKGGLERNVEAVLGRLKDVPEAFEEARQAIESSLQRAEARAKQGSDFERQAIEQLAGPSGANALRAMVLEIEDKYEMQIAEARLRKKRPAETVNQQAQPDGATKPRPLTDDRTHSPGRPELPQVAVRGRGSLTGTDVVNVMNQVAQRLGYKNAWRS